MLLALTDVVLPVFLVALVGGAYAWRRPFPIGALADLIVHLGGACLVFDALVHAGPLRGEILLIPAIMSVNVVGVLVLAAAIRAVVPALRQKPFRVTALPAAFMNAGNLGLPLATLALGDEGKEVAVLFFVTMSVLHYSVGIGLAHGAGGAVAALRVPLLYAAVLGIVVNRLELGLPKIVLVPVAMIGQIVIPLMLLSLGARLYSLLRTALEPREVVSDVVRVTNGVRLWFVIAPVVLRMGGGLLIAVATVSVLELDGVVAKVALLVGALPPAVMNFVFLEKYAGDEEEPALASGAIAFGTLLSMVTMPIVIAKLVVG